MNVPYPDVDGIEWHPATVGDVEGIVELQNACFAVDGGYREVASEIESRFESPMVERSSGTLVGVVAGQVVVSLWSLIVPNATDYWKVYDHNYIHPEYRTPGIAAFAMDWWENRAIQRLADARDDLPVRYHQDVYPMQKDHMSLIEARGYEPMIHFDELRRDLSVPIPDVAIPEGLRIVKHESVAPEDTLKLRNDAFRDHRGSQAFTLEMWKSRESEFSRPDASFVLLDGDRPVSYAFCAVYPHDFPDKGYSEGWIEGVGTTRSHRGRGLASALISEAMKVFASDGLDYATLGVDTENPTGATSLYAGLGFEHAGGYVQYAKTVDRNERTDG